MCFLYSLHPADLLVSRAIDQIRMGVSYFVDKLVLRVTTVPPPAPPRVAETIIGISCPDGQFQSQSCGLFNEVFSHMRCKTNGNVYNNKYYTEGKSSHSAGKFCDGCGPI